jgi:methoxymalonate biosynthesis acyl carrier protein
VTSDQTAETAPATAEAVEAGLTRFLESRTKTTVPADQDLFASGLVSSMFAMELVVHLEGSHDIAIVGQDLKLENFRTVERMVALVLRLQGEQAAATA